MSATNTSHYVKWITVGSSKVQSLSLRSPSLLLTSTTKLHQYRTSDGQLTRVVVPPEHFKNIFHGIESKHGTFFVCYRGTLVSEARTAVSDLFNVRLFSGKWFTYVCASVSKQYITSLTWHWPKGPYTLTSSLVPVAGDSFWCQLLADE